MDYFTPTPEEIKLMDPETCAMAFDNVVEHLRTVFFIKALGIFIPVIGIYINLLPLKDYYLYIHHRLDSLFYCAIGQEGFSQEDYDVWWFHASYYFEDKLDILDARRIEPYLNILPLAWIFRVGPMIFFFALIDIF